MKNTGVRYQHDFVPDLANTYTTTGKGKTGEYRLEFHRGPETEFSVWLYFPGRFALQYPLYDYPRIAELRTILERLKLRDTLIFWEGRYFLASTWLDEEEKVGVVFRSRDNGIALTFHHDDWQAIKNLFRRGWQAPEVRRLWDAQDLRFRSAGAWESSDFGFGKRLGAAYHPSS